MNNSFKIAIVGGILVLGAYIYTIWPIYIIRGPHPPNYAARLNSIQTGLEMFSSDIGDYPSSTPRSMLLPEGRSDNSAIPDQGAHLLVEAMLGLDDLGYQKNHKWGYPLDSGTHKM